METTEIFRCPEQFITVPANTYYANAIFWTGNGQCSRIPAGVLLKSTRLDDVVSPSRVVTYFESTRDWIGGLDWMLPPDIKWWGDYSAKFQYRMVSPSIWGFTGGRHLRTPSRVGGDPWGKDNVALVDGHVRTQVSMQYLVDNEPRGVYLSYPFRPENEWATMLNGYDVAAIEAGKPDVGVEFWTVPWW